MKPSAKSSTAIPRPECDRCEDWTTVIHENNVLSPCPRCQHEQFQTWLADGNAIPVEPPPVGSLARDTRTDRIGQVMPRLISAILRHPSLPVLVTLRPPGGGLEWDVPIEHVERLDAPQGPQDAEATR